MDSVDSIVHGLILGEKLEIPAEASLMAHVTVLLASEDELRQFTQMRFAQNVEFQITNSVYDSIFYSVQICHSKAVTVYCNPANI